MDGHLSSQKRGVWNQSTKRRPEPILRRLGEEPEDPKRHNFIPMHQAKKKMDAKAALEILWETLEKIPAWHLTQVRNKKGGDRWSKE